MTTHLNSSKTIRWGIMSTAQIAENRLIPAIRSSANGAVVAVASRGLEKAQKYADKNEIPLAFGSYEELLASDEIDAIYCPLPTGMHKEWALKCAEAGKPLLCEKPICTNADDAAKVFQAFRDKQLLVSEAYMYLFHPRNQKVRELVRSGEIGDLKSIEATFNVQIPRTDIRYSKELGGGAILDLGCYCVGISRFIAGAEPIKVTSLAHIGDSSEVDETMVGCLQFPDNVFSTFSCSMTTAFEISYKVYGSEGKIEMGMGGMIPWQGAKDPICLIKGEDTRRIEIEDADHYCLMVQAFNEALLNGETELVPHQESLSNLSTLDKLRDCL